MEVRKVFPSAVSFLQKNFSKKVVYNWFEVLWYRSAFCWKYLMSFKILGPRPWYILSKKEILWFLINNYCFQLVSLSNWGRDPPEPTLIRWPPSLRSFRLLAPLCLWALDRYGQKFNVWYVINKLHKVFFQFQKFLNEFENTMTSFKCLSIRNLSEFETTCDWPFCLTI